MVGDLLIRLHECGYDAVGYTDNLAIKVTSAAIRVASNWCAYLVPFTIRYKLKLGSVTLEVKHVGTALDKGPNWNSVKATRAM